MTTITPQERATILELGQTIAVEVKYYGPTNYRPSRIRISLPRTCPWKDTGLQKKFLSRDSIYNNGKEQAADWIREQTGMNPIGFADMGETDVLLYQWYAELGGNNWITLKELIK